MTAANTRPCRIRVRSGEAGRGASGEASVGAAGRAGSASWVMRFAHWPGRAWLPEQKSRVGRTPSFQRPAHTPRLTFDNVDRADGGAWRARPARVALGDGQHLVHAFRHAAKHRVLVVQVRGGTVGDEELAAVGARPGVGHGQNAGRIV